MKNPVWVLFLCLVLCFSFSCKKDVLDSEKAEGLIYEALDIKENEPFEMIEFSLESEEAAKAQFKINGRLLSTKIIKTDEGWMLNEIQYKKDEWIPAGYFIRIKGRLIDETGNALVDKNVMLYELFIEDGNFKTSIKVGDGGILLNPSTLTDLEGNFVILADRRFWEKSGKFTLGVAMGMREVYLRNENDIMISIEVDKDTKQFDMGEIKVKY